MSTIRTRIESTPTTGVTPIVTNITSIALRILLVVSVTIVVTTFHTDTVIIVIFIIIVIVVVIATVIIVIIIMIIMPEFEIFFNFYWSFIFILTCVFYIFFF